MLPFRFLLILLLACLPLQKVQSKEPAAMVVAANPLAVEAGLKMLKAGGSALDAAIAVQLVLGLVEPQSSGIGGGAFLLHYDAGEGLVQAYDGRETAPRAAGADLFLTDEGEAMAFWDAVTGGRAVGTPGLLRMLELAHEEHGRLSWPQLFAPAISLAAEGFEISPRLAEQIAKAPHLDRYPAARAYFYDSDGKPKSEGMLLRNPAYAETLQQLAKEGADVFYEGPIAEDIVAAVRGAEDNPGLLSLEDLAGYEARKRDVLCGSYRHYLVCGMPPPTSGGVAILQILGILETFDLPAMKPDSTEAVHLIAEASRLAFADRNAYLADSDFVEVPVDRLLDSSYLRQRSALIDTGQAMTDVAPGELPQRGGRLPDEDRPSTSHLVVVDEAGNAVSLTTTIEAPFGSRLMVRGFLLNNELTDFAFLPEAEDLPVANRVEGGKRPRSSMAPTLVFDQEGGFEIAVGSPGGPRIIGYTLGALLAMLDWDFDPEEAVSLPNAINIAGPILLEADTPLAELAPELKALGHEVEMTELISGLHAIRRGPEGLLGGADPRREGKVGTP